MKTNTMKNTIRIIILSAAFISCGQNKKEFDASGTFEADEIIVSAEATGVIRQLNIEEGADLKSGAVVGYIDSTQLYLKRKQTLAQIKAVLSKSPNISAQLAAMEEQLAQAEKEQKRFSNLLKADAATQKQVDDINTQISVLKKQIEASRSTLNITSSGLNEETTALGVHVEQLNDQLSKCRIVNPLQGTVLIKYAEANEMTAAGKPLYKVADISSMTLRAYVTGDQLPKLKTGQVIKVFINQGDDHSKEYDGTVEWISDKAEFTPKTIQTVDERANLVYAMKVKIKNDGSLKIGMYADLKIQ